MNGVLKRTIADANPTAPMIVDFSINGSGKKISNLKIANLPYTADVVQQTDYYPYGMVMLNRNGSDNSYRYGFQGQEKDDEVKGAGESINYKYRMHDPRIGRFFAIDPLAPMYPHNSPYAFSDNQVIDGVELEGLEVHLFQRGNVVYQSPLTGPYHSSIINANAKMSKSTYVGYYTGNKTSGFQLSTPDHKPVVKVSSSKTVSKQTNNGSSNNGAKVLDAGGTSITISEAISNTVKTDVTPPVKAIDKGINVIEVGNIILDGVQAVEGYAQSGDTEKLKKVGANATEFVGDALADDLLLQPNPYGKAAGALWYASKFPILDIFSAFINMGKRPEGGSSQESHEEKMMRQNTDKTRVDKTFLAPGQ